MRDLIFLMLVGSVFIEHEFDKTNTYDYDYSAFVNEKSDDLAELLMTK
jgi:hypothetical protein